MVVRRVGGRTVGVGRCLDDVQQAHVRYVVDVYLHLEHDNEALPVQLHCKDRRGKQQLADHRLALRDRQPAAYA